MGVMDTNRPRSPGTLMGLVRALLRFTAAVGHGRESRRQRRWALLRREARRL